MAVRQARREDIPELMQMMRELHAESVYRHVTLLPQKLEAFLGMSMQNPVFCNFVFEDAAGRLQGAYIGRVSNYFFSDDLGGYDILLYVRQEARGTGAAAELWDAYRAWAKAAGAKHLWPGVSTGIHPERAAKFYKRMNLDQVGAVFFGPT